MSWLSVSETSLHCCIIGTLGLVCFVAVVAVVVVLVVGYGLRSVGSECPILHGRLIPCRCGVVGADSLCSFLLTSTLYQELALPFSFSLVALFLDKDGLVHQCIEIRVDMTNYMFP